MLSVKKGNVQQSSCVSPAAAVKVPVVMPAASSSHSAPKIVATSTTTATTVAAASIARRISLGGSRQPKIHAHKIGSAKKKKKLSHSHNHNENDNNVIKSTAGVQNQLLQQRDMVYMYSSLIAGVGSGIISSISCAPFDLIRTRMQVLGELVTTTTTTNSSSTQQLGTLNIVKDVYFKEGYKGFFRGLTASLATVPMFWGVYFPLYDETKRQWQQNYPNMASTNPAMIHCGSAVFAGIISDIICNPMFVVRTRLQTESLHHQMRIQQSQSQATKTTTGMISTIRSLYHEGGMKIFWRGMSANLIGLSHVAVQFPVYEKLKDILLQNKIHKQQHHQYNLYNNINNNNNNNTNMTINPKLSPYDLLLASGISKMMAMILTYPHEVIRSRMMDARGVCSSSSSKIGLLPITYKIYQNEGFIGFYSGLPVSMIRVIPNCCITFITYELLLQYTKQNIFT